MNITFYLRNPLSAAKIIRFKIRLYLFKKATNSADAWKLFDQSNIEGFGTNLIRLYFPVYYDKKPSRESFSAEAKQQIIALLQPAIDNNRYDDLIIAAIPDLLKLEANDAGGGKPYLDNYYFGLLDAAVLGAMMQTYQPAKLIEIGSGISTRYMKLFKDQFKLNTEIICIDPFPREVIAEVADKIITEPLENVVRNFELGKNDIVFLDGSHYVFQGNDTLTFFFSILPSLPAGTILHIHDIYLPYDYAADVAPQLWAEQYILAAMLLAGFKGYEVLYPTYYSSQTNEKIIAAFEGADDTLQTRNFQLRKNHTTGFSFWMKKHE